MTRFAIDARTAIRFVREGLTLPDKHSLVAPALLRSQALSILYREALEPGANRGDAKATLDGITTLRIRLLADRVSRATAWRIAEEHGWDDTTDAEYIAVAKLQADALVATDD